MMKHIGVAVAAMCLWGGMMVFIIEWAAKEDEVRVADINTVFGGHCVPFPPYEQAKVVVYFEQKGFGGRNQFQLAVRTDAGDEEAIFVPAEVILPLAPRPCSP
jgi:hypothetical protein